MTPIGSLDNWVACRAKILFRHNKKRPSQTLAGAAGST